MRSCGRARGAATGTSVDLTQAEFDAVRKLLEDQQTWRLPPGPAGRGEITVYLQALIDWLSSDPWPRDPQFGGSVLTPAAIERKLRVTTKARDRE